MVNAGRYTSLYSSLLIIDANLQGINKVPHFDAKGQADQYFIDAGVPTTFLLASFYWENMIYFGAGPNAVKMVY
jgi:uncharacterized protein YbjT (DUF2867 family)